MKKCAAAPTNEESGLASLPETTINIQFAMPKLPDLRRGKRRMRAALKARINQIKPPKEAPDPQQKDLFSLAQVTADDVRAWLIAVPQLDPDCWRSKNYVIAYDVAGKIAAAKAAGTFNHITSRKGFVQ